MHLWSLVTFNLQALDDYHAQACCFKMLARFFTHTHRYIYIYIHMCIYIYNINMSYHPGRVKVIAAFWHCIVPPGECRLVLWAPLEQWVSMPARYLRVSGGAHFRQGVALIELNYVEFVKLSSAWEVKRSIQCPPSSCPFPKWQLPLMNFWMLSRSIVGDIFFD